MVGDREAVRLVAHALEQLELRRVVREHAAARARPGRKTSSIRLASETTATPRSRKPCSAAEAGRELALAAVDHDQVRQRGEGRVAVGVVRRVLALASPHCASGAPSTSSIAAKSSGALDGRGS